MLYDAADNEKHIVDRGGLTAVLSAMKNLSRFPDVQEAACFALGALCVNNGKKHYSFNELGNLHE